MGVVFILYACETLSLSVLEKRLLRRILGPEREEVENDRENCIMGSFVLVEFRHFWLGLSNK